MFPLSCNDAWVKDQEVNLGVRGWDERSRASTTDRPRASGVEGSKACDRCDRREQVVRVILQE